MNSEDETASTNGEAIIQSRKKQRHTVTIHEAYLFQNHLAAKKLLKNVFDHPVNNPEFFENAKNHQKSLKFLYEEITTHWKERNIIKK